MPKKESPKKDSAKTESKPQCEHKGVFSRARSALTGSSFALIKLILGVCLLPYVYSASVAFLGQFNLAGSVLTNWFWWGAIVFLGLYLIVWEPASVYAKGQKIVEMVFCFFQPLVKTAPFVLPIFMILVLIAYGIASNWIEDARLLNWALFFTGFSAMLHLVFTAKTMRVKKDAMKANYIFGYSFIYIINLGMLAFAFSLIFKEFSFVTFSKQTLESGNSIFYGVFKQLFLIH